MGLGRESKGPFFPFSRFRTFVPPPHAPLSAPATQGRSFCSFVCLFACHFAEFGMYVLDLISVVCLI